MITATLISGNGDKPEQVQSESMDVLRVLTEMFLLPMAGPGDAIKFGYPDK
jgi:hypothetical protein